MKDNLQSTYYLDYEQDNIQDFVTRNCNANQSKTEKVENQ